MLRFIKLVTLTIILLLAIGAVGFIWAKHYTLINWKKYYSNTEIEEYVRRIDESKSLPDNIYKAYELVNPNHLNLKISDMENNVIWSLIVGDREQLSNGRQCNCIFAAERFENRFPINYHSFSWLFLGHALEQRTTELNCFNFLYSSSLEQLSISHFGKLISDLTFEESVELIILFEHPTWYSQNPQLLFNRLVEVLNK